MEEVEKNENAPVKPPQKSSYFFKDGK